MSVDTLCIVCDNPAPFGRQGNWYCGIHDPKRTDANNEIIKLKQWIADLQTGYYVNCVYCGYRYGPKESTPTSLADVLKEHIEKCPDHPMSLLKEKYDKLFAAVKEHHDQKADDRCIFDDDKLYDAAGLPPCDRRVGSKQEMLRNCQRFIDKRCEEGGWPTYIELEQEITALRTENKTLKQKMLEQINMVPWEC